MRKLLALTLALCLALGCAAIAPAETAVPTLAIASDLVGLVDTFGKTSAKNYTIFSSGPGDQTIRYYNEVGERVAYEDQDVLRKNPGVSYGFSIKMPSRQPRDGILDLHGRHCPF